MKSVETDALKTRPTLLSKVRRGDEAGWRRFYEVYESFIYSAARSTGLAHDEASDVVQDEDPQARAGARRPAAAASSKTLPGNCHRSRPWSAIAAPGWFHSPGRAAIGVSSPTEDASDLARAGSRALLRHTVSLPLHLVSAESHRVPELCWDAMQKELGSAGNRVLVMNGEEAGSRVHHDLLVHLRDLDRSAGFERSWIAKISAGRRIQVNRGGPFP